MGILWWTGDAIPDPWRATLVTVALVACTVGCGGCGGGDFVWLLDELSCLITGGVLDLSWWGRSVVAVHEIDDF